MTTQNHSVQLIPVRKAGSFDHWEMSVGGGSPVGPPYPQLRVDHGNNAEFTFTISDAQGIQFLPYTSSTSSPIYIQPGPQKPTSGVDCDIKNIHVHDDPKTGPKTVLMFHDGNQTTGQLAYVLNFKGAPPLDPIVNNGGGGPGLIGAELNHAFFWFAAGAVAVLVTLGIIQAIRRRTAPSRRNPPSPVLSTKRKDEKET